MRPWEANIRKVVPYVPGDQPGGDKLIKLNTNENPYPPAPGAIRALRELETDRLGAKIPPRQLPCWWRPWPDITGLGPTRYLWGLGPMT